jgi:hypothetical protein
VVEEEGRGLLLLKDAAALREYGEETRRMGRKGRQGGCCCWDLLGKKAVSCFEEAEAVQEEDYSAEKVLAKKRRWLRNWSWGSRPIYDHVKV